MTLLDKIRYDPIIQWFCNGSERDNVFLSGGFLLSLLHEKLRFKNGDVDIFKISKNWNGQYDKEPFYDFNNIPFSLQQLNDLYQLKRSSVGNIYSAKAFGANLSIIFNTQWDEINHKTNHKQFFDSFDIKNCAVFMSPSGEFFGEGLDLLGDDTLHLNADNCKESRSFHSTPARIMKYAARGFKIKEKDLYQLSTTLPQSLYRNHKTEGTRYWHNVYIGWLMEVGWINIASMSRKKFTSTAWEPIDPLVIQPINLINSQAAWSDEKDNIKII